MDLTDSEMSDLDFAPKCLVRFLKERIAKYPFLHKIDKVYVNIKTRELTVQVNRKHIKILTENTRKKSEICLMDQEAFDYIKNIVCR